MLEIDLVQRLVRVLAEMTDHSTASSMDYD